MHRFVRFVICLLCLLAASGPASSFGGTPAQDKWLSFTDPTIKAASGTGQYEMRYRLYFPADYDPNGPALPAILFLHGVGERGTDNIAPSVKYSDVLVRATSGATGPHRAIVIIPQCPPGQVWNSINAGDNWGILDGRGISAYSETPAQQAERPISPALQVAMNLLASVQATHRVDGRRVYITGISMGAFGVWDAITRFPEKFAAAMPLSGGANPLAAPALAKMPIWIYHGTKDTVVFPNGSLNVIDAIHKVGGTKIIISQPAVGHEAWSDFYVPGRFIVGDKLTTGGTPQYTDKNVYQWLFSHTLAAKASTKPGRIAVADGQKIAFLGDSITQRGWDLPNGYVRLVVAGLAGNGINVTAIPAGVSGQKSHEMLGRVDQDVISKKPDWMLVSCGVNDVWHGEKGVPLDQYKKNMAAIVDKVQAAGIKVMILTATVIGEDIDNGNNQKLKAYNAFLKELATQKKCLLADLNADVQRALNILEKAGQQRGQMLTLDGVHMKPQGDAVMARGVLKSFGLSNAELTKAQNNWPKEP